jgi:uncharacterized protein (DUF983 family)
MTRWVLQCRNCKTDFEHSQIDDTVMANYFDAMKPKLSEAGVQCVCPNCGHAAFYRRTDLLYRRAI